MKKHLAAISLLLFLAGFGVRLLAWCDARYEVGAVQTAVTENYKRLGRLLARDGLLSFFNSSSAASDPDLAGHPPGYSFLWAAAFRWTSEPEACVQIFQIACDAAAAVLVFLIALELFRGAVAVIAGALVALAPQFTWNSVLLLPDTLSVLPVILAAYCLVRALRPASGSRLALFVVAGMLVGLSCWLRANALLLAPFLSLFMPLFAERGRRTGYAAALLCGAVLVIAPLTLRNAVSYGHFIPVSLGAGQTMLEGIADYDRENRFGIPATDLGIMREEAREFDRPDYAETLFGPDAVLRERTRLRRARTVIFGNPGWFVRVMMKRALSMLRLERARTVAARPPVTHLLEEPERRGSPAWSAQKELLMETGARSSPRVEVSIDESGLRIVGDDVKYGAQFLSGPIEVRPRTDNVLQVPFELERGRLRLEVIEMGGERVLASRIVEMPELLPPGESSLRGEIELPFTSMDAGRVRFRVSNEAAERPVVKLLSLSLYELGPTGQVWTRYPRFIIHALQKLFLTATMLPLLLVGILTLGLRRQWRTLALLCAVPSYYLAVQSAVHTEYRYVLVIHHFFFILAAYALYTLAQAAGRLYARRFKRQT